MSDVTYTIFDNPSQIKTFPEDLKFRVYYLEATLSIFDTIMDIDFPSGLIGINAFHSGVGFQSTDKSKPYEFTLDMIVKDGFTLTSILPEIREGELIWNNAPVNTIGSFIDRNYWERSTYICTITSAQVTDIMRWTLDTWQPKNPIYSLFYGIPTVNDIFNPTFRPAFCDNYSHSIFFYIQNQNGGQFTDPVNTGTGFNVCIDYCTPPNISSCAFISTDMVQVDYETDKGAIVNFYIELETALMQVIIDEERLMEIIRQLREDPGNIELIREAEQLIFEILLELAVIYEDFEVVYYYGYDANNQPAYWRINDPTILLQYLDSNLLRSYPPTDINGTIVNDTFTCATCHDCETLASSNTDLVIIALIILIFLIIVITILLIYVLLR